MATLMGGWFRLSPAPPARSVLGTRVLEPLEPLLLPASSRSVAVARGVQVAVAPAPSVAPEPRTWGSSLSATPLSCQDHELTGPRTPVSQAFLRCL